MFVGDNPEADVAGARAGIVPGWKYVSYWEMNIEDVITIYKLAEIVPRCLER